MKKILLIILLALIPSFVYAQVEILYNANPNLSWDSINEFSNGDPFLPEDIVSYEVFLWNTAMGNIEEQEIENLIYFGTTLNKQITLAFPNRYNWAAAVRVRVTDITGETVVSGLAYTTNTEDVAALPFTYTPDLEMILELLKVTNLKDSGI